MKLKNYRGQNEALTRRLCGTGAWRLDLAVQTQFAITGAIMPVKYFPQDHFQRLEEPTLITNSALILKIVGFLRKDFR